MVHSTICSEEEVSRAIAKRPRQRRRISVRASVRLFPEQSDELSSQIYLAHSVFVMLIRDTLAWCRFRANRNCRREEDEEGQPKFCRVFHRDPIHTARLGTSYT